MLTYDVARPSDKGGGTPPAIPVELRNEFVNDVNGVPAPATKPPQGSDLATQEVPPMSRAEIIRKWRKKLADANPGTELSDRTAENWIGWARGLKPIDMAGAA